MDDEIETRRMILDEQIKQGKDIASMSAKVGNQNGWIKDILVQVRQTNGTVKKHEVEISNIKQVMKDDDKAEKKSYDLKKDEKSWAYKHKELIVSCVLLIFGGIQVYLSVKGGT